MTFIIVALVLAVFVAIVFASMRSGPRITTIEHRHDKAEKPEDNSDA